MDSGGMMGQFIGMLFGGNFNFLGGGISIIVDEVIKNLSFNGLMVIVIGMQSFD